MQAARQGIPNDCHASAIRTIRWLQALQAQCTAYLPIGDFGRQLAGFRFRHDHDSMGGILMYHHRVFGPGERGIFLPVDTQEPVIVTASNAD